MNMFVLQHSLWEDFFPIDENSIEFFFMVQHDFLNEK